MSSSRILVVDDSPTTRRAITIMLASGGYECVGAQDGFEALKVLESEDIDLVVTDLYMPALDGLGLVKAMRTQPSTLLIPVLVLTTADGEDVAGSLRMAGATGVLEKPISQDSLRDAVRRCLPTA